MLDLLIYRQTARLPQTGDHAYQVAGKTCLAGDIFGEARFPQPLKVGDRISIADAAGYTMVKKTGSTASPCPRSPARGKRNDPQDPPVFPMTTTNPACPERSRAKASPRLSPAPKGD